MSVNQTNWYTVDPHAAEWYDDTETYTEDVDLIRSLLPDHGDARILEPFCGTGRILLPLAADGHELVGLDQAESMLERARRKAADLPSDTRNRITLIEQDVTKDPWPGGFDVVILGGNCFYELATAEEQEGCIRSAAEALKPGGHVFIDNDHMEGDLDPRWAEPGVSTMIDWTGKDGTRILGTCENVGFDIGKRLWRGRRKARITFPDGKTIEKSYIQQKHPVSAKEVEQWLAEHHFSVEKQFGDWKGNAYHEQSPRTIFWARKA